MKYLFVKVPRTASRSMEATLQKHDPNYLYAASKRNVQKADIQSKSLCTNHYPVRALRLENLLPDDWYYARYKFAFVRNPWDRLVSWWRIASNNNHSIRYLKDVPSFEALVAKIYHRGTHQVRKGSGTFHPVQQQWRWVLPDFNYVGAYERLQADWLEVSQAIDIDVKLNAHRSLHKDHGKHRRSYTDYYTPRLEKMVGEMYLNDRITFGYSAIEDREPYSSKVILRNLRQIWTN